MSVLAHGFQILGMNNRLRRLVDAKTRTTWEAFRRRAHGPTVALATRENVKIVGS